jgi:hypothetical protein
MALLMMERRPTLLQKEEGIVAIMIFTTQMTISFSPEEYADSTISILDLGILTPSLPTICTL